MNVTTAGIDVIERFSPGSYIKLTESEALSKPPFDLLPAGRVLSLADPALSAFFPVVDNRTLKQIVISSGTRSEFSGLFFTIGHIAALTDAARKPPALSDASAMVVANQETWTTPAGGQVFASATAAHQFARYNATVAIATADAAAPVDLSGVL